MQKIQFSHQKRQLSRIKFKSTETHPIFESEI
jgi:hypothetical protein